MPSEINNSATTTYQFVGSSTTETVTSNVNQITLEDVSGLVVSKTSSPTTFSAGDIITYTVRITNNTGTFLTGVRIIDDLGGGNLAYVSGSASLSSTTTYPVSPSQTSPLTFALQQLNNGQSMTLTYKAQVVFDLPVSFSTITNSVRAIGYTSTGTVNGSASSRINRRGVSGLSIRKTASETEVLPRENFTYYITLTNGSDNAVADSTTTDQLPPNFVISSVELKIGTSDYQTLVATDYVVSNNNLFTIPSISGPIVTVPANGETVIAINGYFL